MVGLTYGRLAGACRVCECVGLLGLLRVLDSGAISPVALSRTPDNVFEICHTQSARF